MIAYAPLTIVCDGCFSNLRRSLCKSKVEIPSCLIGLILENCNLPYANHMHGILADPYAISFYQISDTETRCLVDVPGQKVPSISNSEMARYLKSVVAPKIPPELYTAFIAAIDEGNIRTMPNRSMPADPQRTPGAHLLGDAFNMRHPLTGGGMTVALFDIVILRNLLRPLRKLDDALTINNHLESFYTLQANGIYNQHYCRCHLRSINPSPWSLFLYFLAMAIFGLGPLLLPFPSPKRLWLLARVIKGASGIMFPIIKAERVRQLFFPATIPAYYRAPPVCGTEESEIYSFRLTSLRHSRGGHNN